MVLIIWSSICSEHRRVCSSLEVWDVANLPLSRNRIRYDNMSSKDHTRTYGAHVSETYFFALASRLFHRDGCQSTYQPWRSVRPGSPFELEGDGARGPRRAFEGTIEAMPRQILVHMHEVERFEDGSFGRLDDPVDGVEVGSGSAVLEHASVVEVGR